MAEHVVTCINLARAILATNMGEKAFINLGKAFQEETREKRWYGASSMDEVADIYLKTLVRNWPPTIVDETLSNPDNMGNTHRPSELGEGEFNTRKHPISLNAGVLCQWLPPTSILLQLLTTL